VAGLVAVNRCRLASEYSRDGQNFWPWVAPGKTLEDLVATAVKREASFGAQIVNEVGRQDPPVQRPAPRLLFAPGHLSSATRRHPGIRRSRMLSTLSRLNPTPASLMSSVRKSSV